MWQRACFRRFAGYTSPWPVGYHRNSLGLSTNQLRAARPPYAQFHTGGLSRIEAPIHSSLTFTALTAAAACLAIGGSILVHQDHWHTSKNNDTTQASESHPDLTMVGEVLPGRPGNLTAEQSIKLQQFWKAALKVFGVPLGEVSGLSDSVNGVLEGDEDDDEVEDGKEGDKKKKRRSLFRRKRKDTKSSKGDENPSPEADSEDKYGQTKEFHQALAENTPEELRKAFWDMVKHDHPDALMLRFLRARKWEVEKALVMMVSTMNWRAKEMHVDDDVVINGEGGAVKDAASSNSATKKEGEDFLTQLRMGKSFLHGTDKEGRPMCIVRARLHRQGEQSEKSLEKFTVHVIETCRLLLQQPVDTATIVFDMTNFSLANMDYTPVKFMIKVLEANYPESLGVVLVHKAPWVFQGIWKIIKGWLDPVVAGKVNFTNNVNELSKFIERSRIIKEMDGDEDWEYHYVEPVEGENSKINDTTTRDRLQEERKVTVKEFEDATREWLHKEVDDHPSIERRNNLAEKLRKGYWELDPYIRARSLYDRTGIITPTGHINFYPQELKQADAQGTETSIGDVD